MKKLLAIFCIHTLLLLVFFSPSTAYGKSNPQPLRRECFEFGSKPMVITRAHSRWVPSANQSTYLKDEVYQDLLYKSGKDKYSAVPLSLVSTKKFVGFDLLEELSEHYHDFILSNMEMEELAIGGSIRYLGYCRFPVHIGSKWTNNKPPQPGNSDGEKGIQYKVISANISLLTPIGYLNNVFVIRADESWFTGYSLSYVAPKLGVVRYEVFYKEDIHKDKARGRDEIISIRYIDEKCPTGPITSPAFIKFYKKIQSEEKSKFDHAQKNEHSK